ncbi:MAG TPA: GNAT family N-acetyltransferase [Thermoanaerobaculia bacterium]|nr:GNAT family N-acetyltransferase [Thermoanaerobaculia bacterium]
MNVHLRPAKLEDVDPVVHLLAEAELLSYPEVDGPEALRRTLASPCAVWLVAVGPEGAVVGSVRGNWDGSRALLQQIVVARSARRQGIGKLLTEGIVASFGERGAPTVAVTVSPESVGFFAALGFLKTPITLMLRSLPRA